MPRHRRAACSFVPGDEVFVDDRQTPFHGQVEGSATSRGTVRIKTKTGLIVTVRCRFVRLAMVRGRHLR